MTTRSEIMAAFNALPTPNIIDEVSQDEIFNSHLLPRVRALLPEWTPEQSDPMYLALWDMAGYTALTRQYFNARMLGQLIRFASGNDLEHLVSILGYQRYQGENDDDLRFRAVLGNSSKLPIASRSSIIARALGARNITGAFPQIMSDYSINVYVTSSRNLTSTATNIPTATSNADLEDATKRLDNLYTKYIIDDIYAVQPIYRQYTINAAIQYDSTATDRTIVEAGVKTALNKFVIDNIVPGRIITRSGIISAIHAVGGVVTINLTTPGSNRVVTATQYSSATWATHANPPSGITNPAPFLPSGAGNTHRQKALQTATAWYCFPDALVASPVNIRTTFSTI